MSESITTSLSWEKYHGERLMWSNYLFNLLNVETTYQAFMKATDLDKVRLGFHSLNRSQQVTLLCELFCQIALYESSWNEKASVRGLQWWKFWDKNTYACGLLQMSVEDQEGFNTNTKFSYQMLCTAIPNLTVGVQIMKNQISKHGRIFMNKGESGIFWATILLGGKYDKSKEITQATQALKV